MMLAALCLTALGQVPGQVSATQTPGETPRQFTLELKLGPYTPLIDTATFDNLGVNDQRPYARVFGGTPMLMGEIGLEYLVWQRFGTIGVGATVSYAEKFGKALDAETGQAAEQSTGLRLLPIKPTVSYRFDLLAFKYKVPLVPYVKAAFVTMPWWVVNGGKLEYSDGLPAQGVAFGGAGTLGVSFLMDILDQRLARDFDSSVGVNHTYLFAEFTFQEMAHASSSSLILSSRHWLFGLAFDL